MLLKARPSCPSLLILPRDGDNSRDMHLETSFPFLEFHEVTQVGLLFGIFGLKRLGGAPPACHVDTVTRDKLHFARDTRSAYETDKDRRRTLKKEITDTEHYSGYKTRSRNCQGRIYQKQE